MNRNLTVTVIYLLSFSIVTIQAQSGSIDDLLNKIFISESPPPAKPQPMPRNQQFPAQQLDGGGGKVCGVKKECVDRFLCDANGAVIRNGETVIDIRLDLQNPCNYLEVCCSTEERVYIYKLLGISIGVRLINICFSFS